MKQQAAGRTHTTLSSQISCLRTITMAPWPRSGLTSKTSVWPVMTGIGPRQGTGFRMPKRRTILTPRSIRVIAQCGCHCAASAGRILPFSASMGIHRIQTMSSRRPMTKPTPTRGCRLSYQIQQSPMTTWCMCRDLHSPVSGPVSWSVRSVTRRSARSVGGRRRRQMRVVPLQSAR